MNILFVWTSPFRDAGGVGRVTTTLGPELVKYGHRVSYLSLSKGEEYSDDSGIVQYFCLDDKSAVSKQNLGYVSQLLADLKVDIIINQSGLYPDIIKGLNKVKPEGVRILSVHHNCISCLQKHHKMIIRENYKNHPLFPLINQDWIYSLLKYVNRIKYGRYFSNCIRYSDRLVLLSEKFIPELEEYTTDYPHNKVTGIPNPAPFSAVNDEDLVKENRLLFVGRINFQQKRADRLVGIWKRLHKLYPGWEFDVVGDGPALKDLKKMADEENLDRIYFHGHSNPKPFLEKAKIFTLTSDFEGFGMVLVEAQAYGVVPVAFRCFSAIGDIINNGKNGIIVENFSLENFTNSLIRLMENEPLRKKMGKSSLESVGKFEPSMIAGKWNELFDDVI